MNAGRARSAEAPGPARVHEASAATALAGQAAADGIADPDRCSNARTGGGSAVMTIHRGTAAYPAALADIPEPPDPVYAIGDPTCLAMAPEATVAIVGTRDASPHGTHVAEALGRAFAEAGVVVVSGLARGIDAAAHRGALAAGGRTVAVLGTGPDVPYPASHRTLHQRIAASGLILSENPPGRHAFKSCFPRRNRLIAALSKVTIVVEAPFKSGALNTASQALELGRVVAAVPGPIGDARCLGSNTILRDGAHVLASIDDALTLAGVSRNRTVPRLAGGIEADIWDKLADGPSTVDSIAEAIGHAAGEVAAAISRLELAGLVSAGADGSVRADPRLTDSGCIK
jgi:DNA processing protein